MMLSDNVISQKKPTWIGSLQRFQRVAIMVENEF